MKKHLGVTLIELVVTLAILAVLTAIAIPAYRGYIGESRMTEARNNIAALKLAEEEFYLENNAYFGGGDTPTLQTNSSGLWRATGDDQGNLNFDYAVTLSGGGYTAQATGKPGTPVAGKIVTYTKP